jgi:type VI protein secretion system component Hcp
VYTVVLHDVQVVEVKDLMLTQFDPSYTEYGPRQQIKLLPTSVTWTYEANGSSTQYANTAK